MIGIGDWVGSFVGSDITDKPERIAADFDPMATWKQVLEGIETNVDQPDSKKESMRKRFDQMLLAENGRAETPQRNSQHVKRDRRTQVS